MKILTFIPANSGIYNHANQYYEFKYNVLSLIVRLGEDDEGSTDLDKVLEICNRKPWIYSYIFKLDSAQLKGKYMSDILRECELADKS